MSQLRMLACFAHPDDEVFSCGGVMILNAQRGIHTTLICATRGEAGEISDPVLATPETLGLVRTQELTEAATKMGVHELHFLGYRDSGMSDTVDNDNPVAYARASAAAVVPRLVRWIRQQRPHLLITFDPTGGYGHPDHIAIHHHATAALHAAADPACQPDLGTPWQTARLYYPAFNRDIFTTLRDQLIAQGEEPTQWGDSEDGSPDWPEQSVDVKVDVSAVIDAKWSAFQSHRTQFGQDNPFRRVPEALIKEWLSEEWFEQAWPATKPAQPDTDLFADLITDRADRYGPLHHNT